MLPYFTLLTKLVERITKIVAFRFKILDRLKRYYYNIKKVPNSNCSQY